MKGPTLLGVSIAAACGVLASSPAAASVTTTITSRTSTSQVTLPLPGGGSYTADVTIEFDNPQKLSASCLNVTADILSPTERADVASRMPVSGLAVDDDFPVRITISPPAGCGLAFDNQYEIEIHTDDLSFTPYTSPYRLYKAPVGGAFHDITSSVTQGSVRVRGRGGAFSEFVIVGDSTSYASNASAAYDALASELSSTSIASNVRAPLMAEVTASRTAFNSADYATALADLAPFEDDVAAVAGTSIPNKWQAAPPALDNVTGELMSLSGVLHFYLGRLNGAP